MILAAGADWILSNPDRVVLIEGHCDERGTNQHKGALGEQRQGGIELLDRAWSKCRSPRHAELR
jgi:hypothetical protein